MARLLARDQFAHLGVIPSAPGYYVYQLWSGPTCLYVGRVGNSGPQRMLRRLGQHARSQPWWPEVTRVKVETFATHEEIVATEQRLIGELGPVHNRQYSPICINGHDKSVVGVYGSGQCKGCCRQWVDEHQTDATWREQERERQRERERGAKRKEYYRVRDRQRTLLGPRRIPPSGQNALF